MVQKGSYRFGFCTYLGCISTGSMLNEVTRTSTLIALARGQDSFMSLSFGHQFAYNDH